MTSANAQASLPADPQDTSVFLSTDILALAAHMDDCKRPRGPFFSARTVGDMLRELVSSRVVSTGALLGAVALCVLLVLAWSTVDRAAIDCLEALTPYARDVLQAAAQLSPSRVDCDDDALAIEHRDVGRQGGEDWLLVRHVAQSHLSCTRCSR